MLLLVACVLKNSGPETVRADPRVAAGDTLYEGRALHPANLDLAMGQWIAVLADDPADTLALARLARAEWVKWLVDPEADLAHLENGEEYGWRCLLAFPGFGVAARTGGFRIDADTAAALPKEASPCVSWTLANGLARVRRLGPGAALDLEPLAVLADRLGAVAPGGQSGMGWWALARLRLEAGDTVGAREAFDRAVDAEPSLLFLRQERKDAFPDADEARVAEDGEWTLENEAVRARAASG